MCQAVLQSQPNIRNISDLQAGGAMLKDATANAADPLQLELRDVKVCCY